MKQNQRQPRILIIYTGGTIGMVNDVYTNSLVPFDFENILKQVPELKRFGYELNSISFDPLIDSSNITLDTWINLAIIIENNYYDYDGFVILHGTDTMAYSSSALSFLLHNLQKPVIFTGSQLPIGTIRTDGKENFITAIEIAAAREHGKAKVPEVCVYFENKLYRGNRTTKQYSESFNAFKSHNYPALAEVGIHINYDEHYIASNEIKGKFHVSTNLESHVAVLKIFPGITQELVQAILGINGLKGVVLESYGTGNAPTEKWFLDAIKESLAKGIIMINVSQCPGGRVEMGLYETSRDMLEAGLVNGQDITKEAALTKLMYLLGEYQSPDIIKAQLNTSLRGEISF